MRKKIACQEIEEIDLEFKNGEIITLRFDADAAIALSNLDGGLTSLFKEGISIPDICAKIIYAGAVSNNNDMTYEKAREVVSNLSMNTITEIISAFNEEMGIANNEINQEYQKKTMAQLLQMIAK